MTDKPATSETLPSGMVTSETLPKGMVTVTVTKLGADKIATGNPGDGYNLNEYYGNKAKITMSLEAAVDYENRGWVVSD